MFLFLIELIFCSFNFNLQDSHLRTGDEHSAWFHQEIRTVDDAVVEMDLFAYRWAEPPRFLRTPGK